MRTGGSRWLSVAGVAPLRVGAKNSVPNCGSTWKVQDLGDRILLTWLQTRVIKGGLKFSPGTSSTQGCLGGGLDRASQT
jgi:hypothetical protein